MSLQPYRLFGVLSFVYVGAMVSSNSSLAWISYPTQVCVERKREREKGEGEERRGEGEAGV